MMMEGHMATTETKTTKRQRRRSLEKRKYSFVRHPFYFKLIGPDGKKRQMKVLARVIPAKTLVTLAPGLEADHVRESIKLEGVGNTTTCSGAICMTRHAHAFPHPVEGYVDFQRARAFVVSKLDANGLPTECYAYEHRHADITKLNDDPNGGQKKLLAYVEAHGPIEIELLPYRKRSKPGRPGKGRKPSGRRSRAPGKGARLRYAVLEAGYTPVTPTLPAVPKKQLKTA
jgi:hypothetical protein